MSKEIKHTPGPWRCEWSTREGAGNERGWHVFDAKQEAFVINVPDSSTAKANANLIAAAPEILEALQAVVDNLSPKSVFIPSIYTSVIGKAKAAIEKATGGTNK